MGFSRFGSRGRCAGQLGLPADPADTTSSTEPVKPPGNGKLGDLDPKETVDEFLKSLDAEEDDPSVDAEEDDPGDDSGDDGLEGWEMVGVFFHKVSKSGLGASDAWTAFLKRPYTGRVGKEEASAAKIDVKVPSTKTSETAGAADIFDIEE